MSTPKKNVKRNPERSANADPREWHDEAWCRYPIQRVTRDLHTRLAQQREEVVAALTAEPSVEQEPLSNEARIFLIHLKGHLDSEIAMVASLLWSEDGDYDPNTRPLIGSAGNAGNAGNASDAQGV